MHDEPPLALALRKHADTIYDAMKPLADIIKSIETSACDDAIARAKENALCSLHETPAAIHLLAHVITKTHQQLNNRALM